MDKELALELFGERVIIEAEGYYETDFGKNFWSDLTADERHGYFVKAIQALHKTALSQKEPTPKPPKTNAIFDERLVGAQVSAYRLNKGFSTGAESGVIVAVYMSDGEPMVSMKFDDGEVQNKLLHLVKILKLG